MTEFLVAHLFFITIAGLIMAIGVVGTFVPILPGTPLIWLGGLIYALLFSVLVAEGKQPLHIGLSIGAMLVLTVFMVIAIGSGFVMPSAGGAATGASTASSAASCVLGVIGFFVIPIIGALIGAALGIFLVEYLRERRKANPEAFSISLSRTRGTLIGFGLGFVVEIGCALIMIGVWVAWIIVNIVWVQA